MSVLELPSQRRHGSANGSDDVAIFIDDSFSDAVTRHLVGTAASASTLAMLSPSRDAQRAPSHLQSRAATNDNGTPGRLSNGRRTFAADVSNRSTLLKRHPNSNLFSSPNDRLARDSSASPLTTSVQEPTPSGFVSLADHEALKRECERLRSMYEHQKAMCDATVERHVEDYQKLQDSIAQCIGLTSRLEESKRFVRQIKKELLESRAKTLPLHNARIEMEKELQQLADERVKERIAIEQQKFSDLLDDSVRRIHCLEDIVSEVAALPRGAATGSAEGNHRTLLFHAFTAIDRLRTDIQLERDTLAREVERRRRAERLLEEYSKQRRELDVLLEAERLHHREKEKASSDYIQRLQTALAGLYDELYRKGHRGDEKDADGPPALRDSSSDDEEEGASPQPAAASRSLGTARTGGGDAGGDRLDVSPIAIEAPSASYSPKRTE